MSATKKVKVISNETDSSLVDWVDGIESTPQNVEIMAESIQTIANAMKKLSQTRLSRRALVILLKDQTGLGIREIDLILDSLTELEETWLTPVF